MMRTELFWHRRVSCAAALMLAAAVAPFCAIQGQSWKSVNGTAYAGWVKTGGTEQWVTVANLPGGGGSASTDALDVSVPGMLKSHTTTAVTSGALSSDLAGVSSVATASDVDVLNGLITARQVIAISTLSQNRNKLESDADGSSITGLMVNGVAYGADDALPAANTRVELPGVGYAILNEQIGSTRGRGTSFTVNMIHVVLVDQSSGAKSGDIIVGSATSSDS